MDRHVRSRLQKEKVIWLVTADRAAKPQAVPVWFHWDGESFLIFSVDGAKARHVRANPNVELHLNSDEVGDDLVRVSGHATILRSRPAARARAYLRKYRSDIRDLGASVDDFERRYHNPIQVTRLRYH